MSSNQAVNYEAKLKHMPVLESNTGAKLGALSDLIINPEGGKLLGITILRTDLEARAVAMEYVHIGKDAIMLMDQVFAAVDFSGVFAQGVLASDILKANVVTQDGRLIGRIKEIYITPGTLDLHYRVAESTLQRLLGGGLFFPAAIPSSLSPDRKRFIVPVDFESKYARKSLE
jgi:uncharacterized protein YrrD